VLFVFLSAQRKMHPRDAIVLFAAALAAGIANSLASGGSFISFPALLLTGAPAIEANATNTVALLPGTIASAGAYWEAMRPHRRLMLRLAPLGVVGGSIGGIVLLRTPQQTFLKMVPWLLLISTIIFIFSGRITAWVRRRTEKHPRVSALAAALIVFLQLLVCIYTGYFGAGAGIPFLALFALMGLENIHAINGLRTYLISVCNLAALVVFLWAGAILWPQAMVMTAGAALGGYGGARFAQKMNPRGIRYLIIAIGLGMSAYFFYKLA
jgi:uncharacterized membrane protein YfcA